MTENIALLKKIKEGDEKARCELIENNMGLVKSIAQRFTGRGYDFEEIYQVGAIGLIKAADRFDLGFDVQFSTYAVPLIMGEIKKFLRDDGPIKVSRSLKELAQKVITERERLSSESGREVTISELSESLMVEREKIIMALEAVKSVSSIYEPSREGEDDFLLDYVADKKSSFDEKIEKMALSDALSRLNKKERTVIVMRYFRNMTQVALAELMGVSQVQVSRIEKSAREKIKRFLE